MKVYSLRAAFLVFAVLFILGTVQGCNEDASLKSTVENSDDKSKPSNATDEASGTKVENISEQKNPENPTVPKAETALSPMQILDQNCQKPFSPTLIPNAKAMLSILIKEYRYEASPPPKALAMSADGFGFPSVLSLPTATLADARRIALNACNAISGGKPCRIIVENNTFCPNGPEKEVLMAKPTTLEEAPFAMSLSPLWTERVAIYKAVTVPKAWAVSIGSGFATYTSNQIIEGNITTAARTLEEASRLALEKCEAVTILSPCTLFAVGNQVVLDIKNMNWTPRLDFSRKTLGKPVPFIADVYFDQFWTPRFFPNQRPANFQGAIYVSSASIVNITTGANADTESRDACMQVNEGVPCLKFALNNQVTMGPEYLNGLKANKEIFCKVMPRASCEIHRSVGCTSSGTYYIGTGSEVKEMNCTF